MSAKLVNYGDTFLPEFLENQNKINKVQGNVVKKVKDLLENNSENEHPLVGVLLLRLGVEICKRCYGLPQTYALISEEEISMRQQLQFLLEGPTEETSIH